MILILLHLVLKEIVPSLLITPVIRKYFGQDVKQHSTYLHVTKRVSILTIGTQINYNPLCLSFVYTHTHTHTHASYLLFLKTQKIITNVYGKLPILNTYPTMIAEARKHSQKWKHEVSLLSESFSMNLC